MVWESTIEKILGIETGNQINNYLCPYFDIQEGCIKEEYWKCINNGGVSGCCNNANEPHSYLKRRMK